MGSPLIYLIVGIAFLAALSGVYYKVHHDGYEQGVSEVRLQWDKANKEAEAKESERQMAAKLIADTSKAELAAAQQKATTYEAQWRAERNKHANQTLAGCSQSPTVNSTDTTVTQPITSDVRFSLGFVRLYDGAWTGKEGKPIFSYQSSPESSGTDTPDALTSIGPGEVLDNHQINAERCSSDRRKLNSLIDQIEKLKSGWK